MPVSEQPVTQSWVQSLVNGVRDYAISLYNSALSWATTQATNAYNSAVAWIQPHLTSLTNTINYYHSLALNVAYSIRDNLTATFSPVWNTISYYYNLAVSYANTVKNDVIAFVQGQINTSVSTLLSRILGLDAQIKELQQNPLSDISSLLEYVRQTQTVFTLDNLSRLAAFLRDGYSFVTLFMRDPAGFIFNLIFDPFLTFLSYVLGYAMGTTVYELPVLPVWGNADKEVILIGAPVGDTDKEGLYKPVDPLYISGTHFSAEHPALDLGIFRGQAIYAMHDGVISWKQELFTGYGFALAITGERWWTRYGHCQQLLVDVGQTVRAGQIIAYGDSTGNSTGDHLHLEMKLNGQFVDPETILF